MTEYALRPAAGRAGFAWAALLAPVLATLPALWWHIDVFGRPGPAYRLLLLAAIPGLLIGFAGVHAQRRRFPASLFWPVLPLLPALLVLLIRRPAATLAVAAYAGSLIACGAGAARLLGLPKLPAAATLAMQLALGSATITVVIAAAGKAGLLVLPLAALLLLPAAVGVGPAMRSLRGAASAWREFLTAAEGRSASISIVLTSGAVLLTLAAASAASPAFHGDSVRFHLPLAKIYAQQGTIEPTPFLPYGYYPQGFESQLAILYLLAGFPAANLLTLGHLAAFLLLLCAIARLCGVSRAAAVLACGLCLAVPFLHFTASTAKNDMLLSVYLLAALYCVLDGFVSKSTRLLPAGGFLLGAAAGVKHTVAFAGVPLGLLLLWAILRSPRPLRLLAAAAVLGSGAGLFWHVQTWRATGDPLYPPALANVSQIAALSSGHGIQRFVILPYSLQFRGRRHFESHSDSSLGAALLSLAPALLLTRRIRGNTAVRVVLVFLIAFLLFWAAMLSVLRYILPAVALLILFGAARFEILARQGPTRQPALATLAYVFVFALPVTVLLEVFAAQPAFLARRIDETEALRRALPAFDVMQRLSTIAGPADRVLSIGNYALCYAPFPANVKEVLSMTGEYAAADLAPLDSGQFRFLILPDAFRVPVGGREVHRAGGFRLVDLTR